MVATMTPQRQQGSPLQQAGRELTELQSQKRALEAQIDQYGIKLAREGKLTRTGRSELSKARNDLKKVIGRLDRVDARYDRLREQAEQQAQRQRAKIEAAETRDRDRRRKKGDGIIARAEAKSLKAACFARLPEGSKPSKAVSSSSTRAVLTGALLTKQGRGQKARWVLQVTDSYEAVSIPLEVSNEKAVRRAWIPAEALKAIEKVGAFRITPKGAIQPLKVHQGYQYPTIEGIGRNQRFWTASKEGQAAYMTVDPKEVRFPDLEKVMPKPPAKANSLQVRLDPRVLQRAADALGNPHGGVTLTFDLSKVGKASQGRKVTESILVGSNGQPHGVVKPCRPEEA